MSQIINIDWQIPIHERDDYYIRVDCLKETEDKIVRYDCCLGSQERCNTSVCRCQPGDSLKIRLYDKRNNLIDQKEYQQEITTIVILKNKDNIPTIHIK